MCGIAGYFQSGKEVDRSILYAMADTLAHRGPDAAGVWDESGVGLVHRRLAIQDLSAAGAQPMVSDCERYVLVYNGEIYNAKELRAELESCSIVWRGSSDTEVILNYIVKLGLSRTLHDAKGMFAFAIYDRFEGKLTLARDRFGEKPLYYSIQGNILLFASELKALKANPLFEDKIDRHALALFFRYNYVPAPYSIYSNTYKLGAGQFIEFSLADVGSASPVTYWSAFDSAKESAGNQILSDELTALAAVQSVLNQAVERQLISDVPVACLLSGGIDSSLIATTMQNMSSKAIDTYTLGFSNSHYDESVYAQQVAKHIGSRHSLLEASAQDALGVIAKLPEIYDEPFADSSQIPTALIMRLVSNHSSVVLTGDGGDELFAGYNRYTAVPKVWGYAASIHPYFRLALGSSLTSIPAPILNNFSKTVGMAEIGDKAHKLGHRLKFAASQESLYISLLNEWEQKPPVSGYFDGRSTDLLSDKASWPTMGSFEEVMMLMDTRTYMADDILVKVDRASMAFAVEARAPFLDPDLYALAWRLPIALKLKNGEQKYVLKRLLSKTMPRRLFERPKTGFCIPLDEWLRGPLVEWADDLLSKESLEAHGLLDIVRIRRFWLLHRDKGQNFGYRLWSVLMFQLWWRSTVR